MERSEVLKLLDLPETKISVYRTRPKIELRGRISRSLVEEISRLKGEPEWMLKLRLRSLELFEKLPFSNWLQGIDELDLDELAHYVKPETEIRSSWEEIPEDIRRVYEQLGLPEIEAKILAGLATQYDSENVYLGFKKYLEELGVILMDMSEAVVKYPDLVKRYF
ncbi:MAG: Fe-S cluster assembly protein SufB, partial [Thermoprotei archaeon]